MPPTNEVEKIRNKQLFAEKPDSEINVNLLLDMLEFLEDYIRSQKIIDGVADADPPNSANSYITDAAPTTGAITDISVGQTLEITTSTLAANKRFQITAIDTGLNRIEVVENLYDEGVRLGDSYRVIYSYPSDSNIGHDHDGINSFSIPRPNWAIIYAAG